MNKALMNNPMPVNGGLDKNIDMPDEKRDAAACKVALDRNMPGMNEQVKLGAAHKDCLHLKK